MNNKLLLILTTLLLSLSVGIVSAGPYEDCNVYGICRSVATVINQTVTISGSNATGNVSGSGDVRNLTVWTGTSTIGSSFLNETVIARWLYNQTQSAFFYNQTPDTSQFIRNNTFKGDIAKVKDVETQRLIFNNSFYAPNGAYLYGEEQDINTNWIVQTSSVPDVSLPVRIITNATNLTDFVDFDRIIHFKTLSLAPDRVAMGIWESGVGFTEQSSLFFYDYLTNQFNIFAGPSGINVRFPGSGTSNRVFNISTASASLHVALGQIIAQNITASSNLTSVNFNTTNTASRNISVYDKIIWNGSNVYQVWNGTCLITQGTNSRDILC